MESKDQKLKKEIIALRWQLDGLSKQLSRAHERLASLEDQAGGEELPAPPEVAPPAAADEKKLMSPPPPPPLPPPPKKLSSSPLPRPIMPPPLPLTPPLTRREGEEYPDFVQRAARQDAEAALPKPAEKAPSPDAVSPPPEKPPVAKAEPPSAVEDKGRKPMAEDVADAAKEQEPTGEDEEAREEVAAAVGAAPESRDRLEERLARSMVYAEKSSPAGGRGAESAAPKPAAHEPPRPWEPPQFLKPLIEWFKPEGRQLGWDEIIVGRVFPIAGVVIGLLAFVWLATILNNKIGPGARVALMYLGAFGVGGLGVRLDRRYPKLARPMIAGAIALFYFTSYAGHFIEYTQVMSLGVSVALMTVALFSLIGLAELFKSELIAIFTVFLGYLTAYVSGEDVYILISNGVLAVAGMVFLFRNRWVNLSLIAVVGTYAFHFIWLKFWHSPLPEATEFWLNAGILTGYFVILQAGGMFSAPLLQDLRTYKGTSLFYMLWNVGIFFSLMVMTFRATEVYWLQAHWFYWALGVALLGCARFYRERFTMLFHVYTSMATAFITLGIVTCFTGNLLYLILVMESGVLMVTAHRTGLRLVRYSSVLASFIAAAYLVYYFGRNWGNVQWNSLEFVAGCLALVLIGGQGYFYQLFFGEGASEGEERFKRILIAPRFQAWLAALLFAALVSYVFAMPKSNAEEHIAWVLLAAACGAIAAARGMRFPPWLSAGRILLVFGALGAFGLLMNDPRDPEQFGCAIAACALCLGMGLLVDYSWTPKERFYYMPWPRSNAYLGCVAFAILLGTLIARTAAEETMLVCLMAALAATFATAVALRRWSLLDSMLILVAMVAGRLAVELLQPTPLARGDAGLLLVQAAALAMLLGAGQVLRPKERPLVTVGGFGARRSVSNIILLAPALLGVLYFSRNFPATAGSPLLTVAALVVLGVAVVRRSGGLAATGAAWFLVGHGLFHSDISGMWPARAEELLHAPQYLAVLLVMVALTLVALRILQMGLARRIIQEKLERFQKENATVGDLASQLQLALGALLSLLILHGFYQHPNWWPDYTTVAWLVSALALLGLAFGFKAGVYSYCAVAILFAAQAGLHFLAFMQPDSVGASGSSAVFYFWLLLSVLAVTLGFERVIPVFSRMYGSGEGGELADDAGGVGLPALDGWRQAFGFSIVLLILHGFYQQPGWWSEDTTIAWLVSAVALLGLAHAFKAGRYLYYGAAILCAANVAFHYCAVNLAAAAADGASSLGFYCMLLLGALAVTIGFERVLPAALPKAADEGAASPLEQLRIGFAVFIAALVLHGLYRIPVADWTPYVTISWTLGGLALIAIGFAFRARVYPRCGFVILIFAILRAFIVDTQQLDRTERMIAYFVLSLILLSVSFVFMKFKERIAQWN